MSQRLSRIALPVFCVSQTGQRLLVAVDQVGDAVEERRALAGRRARPVGRVEGAPGGRDGGLDLLVGRDVDLGDDGPVRRIDDRLARSVAGRDPRAIDEQAGHDDLGSTVPATVSAASRRMRVPRSRVNVASRRVGRAAVRSGLQRCDA